LDYHPDAVSKESGMSDPERRSAPLTHKELDSVLRMLHHDPPSEAEGAWIARLIPEARPDVACDLPQDFVPWWFPHQNPETLADFTPERRKELFLDWLSMELSEVDTIRGGKDLGDKRRVLIRALCQIHLDLPTLGADFLRNLQGVKWEEREMTGPRYLSSVVIKIWTTDRATGVTTEGDSVRVLKNVDPEEARNWIAGFVSVMEAKGKGGQVT